MADETTARLLDTPRVPKYKLYFGGSLSPNTVKKIGEKAPYATSYSTLSVNLGLEYPLLFQTLPFWDFRKTTGNAVIELDYSSLRGAEINRGSHREQGEIKLGWKQGMEAFLPSDQVFVQAQAGLGVGPNWMDFGKGSPLQMEVAASLGGQFLAGYQYCFDLTCVSGAIGGFVERSFGSTPFSNQGVLFNLNLSTRPYVYTQVELLPKEVENVQTPEIIELLKKRREKAVERAKLGLEPIYCPEPEKPKPMVCPPLPAPICMPRRMDDDLPSELLIYEGHLMDTLFVFDGGESKIKTETLISLNGFDLEEDVNDRLMAIAHSINDYLRQHPDDFIMLHGYAIDSRDRGENQKLATQRLSAVRKYLERHGVDAEKLYVDGMAGDLQGASIHVHGDAEGLLSVYEKNQGVKFIAITKEQRDSISTKMQKAKEEEAAQNLQHEEEVIIKEDQERQRKEFWEGEKKRKEQEKAERRKKQKKVIMQPLR
jgi:outer membrane protein OmpA-like peptidoglycan-associated protein